MALIESKRSVRARTQQVLLHYTLQVRNCVRVSDLDTEDCWSSYELVLWCGQHDTAVEFEIVWKKTTERIWYLRRMSRSIFPPRCLVCVGIGEQV